MLKRLATTPPIRKALADRLAARAWNTPQLGIVLGVLLLLYFLTSFVGLFFYEEQLPLARLVATLLIYTAIVVLIAHVNRQRGGSWADNFGLGFLQLKKLVLSPVLYLAFIPFLILAAKAWHLFLQDILGLEIELQKVAQVIVQELSWLQILYILTAVFIAPFFEEIMFRGMVFPYLVKHAGLAKGTVLVSLLFAAMHFHLPSFLPLFLLAAVLCLAYWRTGSLWVGIGMHAIFNAVSILALNIVD
ncbi:MAG: CPBP family intramembrane metalloprotease [Verrucomicrobia bacterium]|nr:CPBP family intramembrane metalloprotease [Verrucomicrobiota bacterium]